MKEFTVEMFGSFQVFYDGTPIVSKDARNSKVLQLFQYLLCRRGNLVPQEDLIDVLLGGKECGNPVSVLKNLVYRLRKLLEELQNEGMIEVNRGRKGTCITKSGFDYLRQYSDWHTSCCVKD